MNRTITLVLLTLLLGVDAASRPNVILIMTDDQGFGDLSFYGNEKLDTPVMDRLATEGARFDRFFVSPMCAPTRASLLTGRYNLRTGVAWVSHAQETLRLGEVTIADALGQAGYATGCFGKWHNGAYYPYHPNKRGFDEFFGFCWGNWNEYFDAVLERNGAPVATSGFITDVLTDAALGFIERNRDHPFFCYVPYNAPHVPFQVPDDYFDKYKRRGLDDKTACVYGMVDNIDDNLRRILNKLDELDLAEDTIVIFTTDNGPHTVRYNAGMRGIKASVDEGGVRVPLFIRWPGHIQPGTEVTRIAAHIDLFPTILELCDVPMPRTLPQDGLSLVPLLKGLTEGWGDRMIFTHQNRLGETHMTPGSVRTQQYRLVNRGIGDGYELYDMVADPGQKRDVAGQHPQTAKKLAAAYEAWFNDVTSNGVEPPPAPAGHADDDVVEIHAEDARLHGGLAFQARQGWAHDWIINWRSTGDYVTWDIDVLRAGRYEVTLMYTCPASDVGSTMKIEIGSRSAEAVITRAHDPQPEPPGPDRVPRIGEPRRIWTKPWAPLTFKLVALDRGRASVTVRALSIPGSQALELKEVWLRRLD